METTLENLLFEMVTHISFDDCHSMIEHHVVKDENSRLNGKIIVRETHTSKSRKTGNFGKSKSYYYIKEKNSKIYNTLKEFIENEYYEPRQ